MGRRVEIEDRPPPVDPGWRVMWEARLRRLGQTEATIERVIASLVEARLARAGGERRTG